MIILNECVSEEEAKPAKVKIEGRRRLCKISSQDDGDAEKTSIPNEPSFSGICDFDSPLPTKNVCEGGSKIRDILNDLSSKLELLSIEKKAAPKMNFKEYASAESSFSGTSDPSDSSSGVTYNVGRGIEDEVDLCEDQVDFIHKESEKGNEPMVSARQSFESKVEGDERSELQSDNEDGAFVTRVHEPKTIFRRLKKSEPKNAYEQLCSMGRSFASEYGEEEEDNDCVVLSNKKAFTKAREHGGKLKKYDQYEEVDELDDFGDDSLSEGDHHIVLTGPKSTFKLPTKIATMLFPHQREGLKWLWSLHCQGKGGILGDDMGLGKTMQVMKCVCPLVRVCVLSYGMILICYFGRFVAFWQVCFTQS